LLAFGGTRVRGKCLLGMAKVGKKFARLARRSLRARFVRAR